MVDDLNETIMNFLFMQSKLKDLDITIEIIEDYTSENVSENIAKISYLLSVFAAEWELVADEVPYHLKQLQNVLETVAWNMPSISPETQE